MPTSAIPDNVTAAFVGRYTLERELGCGGMATVYLARDLKHDRMVALKVLRSELGATVGPERFLREIRTTARLQHPHILPVFDSGAAGGQLWYAMPYVEGESLRDRMERERQLPLEEALRISLRWPRRSPTPTRAESSTAMSSRRTSCSADRRASERGGCVHALVADFGLAQAVGEAGGGRLTETGLPLSTTPRT